MPGHPGEFGRPLGVYRNALREYLPLTIPERAATLPPAPLYGRARLTWARLERITETFVRIVRHEKSDLIRRLVSCVNVAAALRAPRLATLDERGLDELLDRMFAKIVTQMAEDPLTRLAPLGLEQLAFRQLAGIYGREDRRGERGVVLQRLGASFRMLGGRGLTPPLRRDLPVVPFAALETPLGALPAETSEPLERYLRLHLESMGFFGPGFYGYAYLDGLNALLLSSVFSCWFARIHAVARELEQPDRACIERGIRIVSHQHGMTPAFNFPQERLRFNFLCERATLRRLVVWFGS